MSCRDLGSYHANKLHPLLSVSKNSIGWNETFTFLAAGKDSYNEFFVHKVHLAYISECTLFGG